MTTVMCNGGQAGTRPKITFGLNEMILPAGDERFFFLMKVVNLLMAVKIYRDFQPVLQHFLFFFSGNKT